MKFEAGALYHIYNRGNNKQSIFPQIKNYDFFLKKIEELLIPCCDVLAYCLMPNHFHFLIHANYKSIQVIRSGDMQLLSRRIGTLQSSYTRAINIQETSTGTLFQQKYKSIILSTEHAINCFHYIHNNPVKANLTLQSETWPYSSLQEYISGTNHICQRQLANALMQIPTDPHGFAQFGIQAMSRNQDFILDDDKGV